MIAASAPPFWQIFRTIPVATILRALESGLVLDVNERYADLVGYAREELIGRTVYELDIWAEAAEGERFLAELRRRGTIQEVEGRFRRKSGEIRDVLIASELVSVSGEPTVLGMLIDITEQKRNERALQRSGEQLRALSARLQRIREEERIRIARELHDEIGGFLTVLKLDLSRLSAELGPDADEIRRRLDSMAVTVVSAIGSVRRICSDLRPSLLDHIGLGAAVEWQLAELHSKTGIRYTLSGSIEDDRIDAERATAAFRILQEALTNVVRHAEAKRVTVRVSTEDESLRLEIRDDGRGIDPESVAAPTALGLLGMHERVVPFGGSVDVRRAAHRGTVVEVRMPLAPRAG